MAIVKFKMNVSLASTMIHSLTGNSSAPSTPSVIINEVGQISNFLPGITRLMNYTSVPSIGSALSQEYEVTLENDFYQQDVEVSFTYQRIVISNEAINNGQLLQKSVITGVRTIGYLNNNQPQTTRTFQSQHYPSMPQQSPPPAPSAFPYNRSTFDFGPTEQPKACQHEAVDVGFNIKHMVCKKCNKDMN